MASARQELKEISKAIGVAIRISEEPYVKESSLVASEIADLERKLHRRAYELRTKSKKTGAS